MDAALVQSSKRQRVLVRETPSAGSAGGRSHTRSIEDLRWHYPMLNDHERNAKFCAAVESAVRAAQRALRSRGVDRGVRVLDIGAGSGLLALAAARAGAEHVTACEADPLVAAAASEVIQANGLAHCVTLVPLHSSQLSVEDLRESQPADIVTHELLDSTLLGEDVLPALRDAYARGLVRPDAQSVPWGARIEAQLVESTALWSRRHPPASLWSDNESSPFTVAAAEGGGQQLAAAAAVCPAGRAAQSVEASAWIGPLKPSASEGLAAPTIRALGEPQDTGLQFQFAASAEGSRSHECSFQLPRTASGHVHAVVYWWRLHLLPPGEAESDPHPGTAQYIDTIREAYGVKNCGWPERTVLSTRPDVDWAPREHWWQATCACLPAAAATRCSTR
jgi:hypothetical protein